MSQGSILSKTLNGSPLKISSGQHHINYPHYSFSSGESSVSAQSGLINAFAFEGKVGSSNLAPDAMTD